LKHGTDVRHSRIDNVTKSVQGKARGHDVIVPGGQPLEDVRAREDEKFEDVPHLASKFKGSLHAFHGDHVRVAGDVAENEGDSDGSELLVSVPREGIVVAHAL